MIKVGLDFLVKYQEQIKLSAGSDPYWPNPSLHFASQTPVDPLRRAIYDYIPRALLPKVGNLDDIALGSWLFDFWASNCDKRQAVLTRKRASRESPGRFHLTLIDNGFCFGACQWVLRCLSSGAGLRHRPPG